MATTKPAAQSTMSYKVKTATMRSDYTGSLKEGIEMAFWSANEKERDYLLGKLPEIHKKIADRAAEKLQTA